MTAQEFLKKLENHDWFYEMADSYEEWADGYANQKALVELTKRQPELKPLYDQYYEHVFSGPAWDTEKQPKPVV